MPRNWYRNDKNQYAIQGHRHSPKTPYPKTPQNATFITLGTSSSSFESWKVGRNTRQTGELRAALLLIWEDDTSLADLSLTTDSNKKKVAHLANDSSGQESDQGETSIERDEEEARSSLTSPPAAKRPSEPAPKVTRRVPVRRTAEKPTCNLAPARAHRATPGVYSYRRRDGLPATAAARIQWNKSLETTATTPPDRFKIKLTRFEEPRRDRASRAAAYGKDASTEDDAGAHGAAKGLTAAALANVFNGDTVEHRDIHEQMGVPSTLYGSVFGATVYAGAAPGSEDENRLIMQSSDGSKRLVEVNHMRH